MFESRAWSWFKRRFLAVCTIKGHNGIHNNYGVLGGKLTYLVEISRNRSAGREAFCVVLERLATFFYPQRCNLPKLASYFMRGWEFGIWPASAAFWPWMKYCWKKRKYPLRRLCFATGERVWHTHGEGGRDCKHLFSVCLEFHLRTYIIL